mgnify:CR=1 FL=1
MIQEIAEKYIAELSRLYPISDKGADKLRDASDQIDAALGCYYWTDVRGAIEKYFRTQSDKQRPRIAQIVQILENTRGISKIQPDPEPDEYHLPRTKLWSIQDAFDRVIKAMIRCEILKPENPMDAPLAPGYSLLDTNNLPMLNPKRRLREMTTAAKNRRPDLFAPYPSLSFWEELAVAVQHGLIHLRVRDWHASHQGVPGNIRVVIANRDTNVMGQTADRVNAMIAAWPGAATVGVLEV